MTPEKLNPSKGTAPPVSSASKEAAASAPKAVPESSMRTIMSAAGLPSDKLSAAIVSFARFFTLPLKPELLAAIRRQSMPPPQTPSAAGLVPSDDSGAATKSREVASFREALALAAAESKGVELAPKGLEGFAEAINPDQARRNAEDRGRRREKDRKNQENSPKTSPITASSLKEMALEFAEKDPLLAILNRLPGKNGEYWVVLPFSFDEGNRKFNISLRILLENNQQAGLMALDIIETGEKERSWLFVLDKRNTAVGRMQLGVYLQPELPPKDQAQFAGELSRLLEIPPERISIKSRTETFPGESGDGAAPVNEAV